MARVIRRMWERKLNDVALIHPFCVDLSDPGMVEELVGRLDRTAFAAVVGYDVADPSGGSHAQEIDRNSFARTSSLHGTISYNIAAAQLAGSPRKGSKPSRADGVGIDAYD